MNFLYPLFWILMFPYLFFVVYPVLHKLVLTFVEDLSVLLFSGLVFFSVFKSLESIN